MNAIEFLTKQHREVESLFAELEKAEGAGSGTKRKALFTEIATKLKGHTAAEEQVLYPAGKEVDEGLMLEAYEEHAVAKKLIQTIERTRVNDETFMAKVTVLKEMIEHHVEEEEEEFFPKLEKAFGEERLEILGAELEAAFEKALKRATKKRPHAAPSRKAPHAAAYQRAS